MKHVLRSSIALLSLLAFSRVAKADVATLHLRCNLSDENLPVPQCNIDNKVLDLQSGKTVQFSTYKGATYEVALEDLTGAGDAKPRIEIMLSARDSKTKVLLTAANVVYSLEVPELTLQNGKFTVDCMLER